MTRVDKLKIVMPAISRTILTFLFLFRYLSVYCVSLYQTYLPLNKGRTKLHQPYIWLTQKTILET